MTRWLLAGVLALAPPLAPPAGGTDTGGDDGTDTGAAIDPIPPPGVGPAPPPPQNPDSPLTVTTRLSPEPSHIGDLLTLEVIVAYPSDHAVNLPSSLDFSPLRYVDHEEGEVESTGQDLRKRYTIHLQHFDVGEAEVPSFPITWIDPNDEVHTHVVAPHAFMVERLLGNESDPQLQPEDPMISLEYPNVRGATIIWSVLGGVALATALATALVIWRRRERPVILPPPIPPHERALGELAELARERDELIATGAYQDYYLRLTQIAKRYLGGRFGFEALDRTTEEIQDLLRGRRVSLAPLDADAVLTFLQDCDLVKFARLSPPKDEAHSALETVREFVEVSRPREEAPAPTQPEAHASEAVQGEPGPRASRPARPEPPAPPGLTTVPPSMRDAKEDDE